MELIGSCGQPAPTSNHIPAGQIGCPVTLWRTSFYKKHPTDPDNKAATAGRAFRRILENFKALKSLAFGTTPYGWRTSWTRADIRPCPAAAGWRR
jgi:hypothetical protein